MRIPFLFLSFLGACNPWPQSQVVELDEARLYPAPSADSRRGGHLEAPKRLMTHFSSTPALTPMTPIFIDLYRRTFSTPH